MLCHRVCARICAIRYVPQGVCIPEPQELRVAVAGLRLLAAHLHALHANVILIHLAGSRAAQVGVLIPAGHAHAIKSCSPILLFVSTSSSFSCPLQLLLPIVFPFLLLFLFLFPSPPPTPSPPSLHNHHFMVQFSHVSLDPALMLQLSPYNVAQNCIGNLGGVQHV